MPKDNKYRVSFSLRAERQLDSIYKYIADAVSSDTAARYIEAIAGQCGKLDMSPLRGARRDDLFPGLRVLIYKKRIRITYLVNTELRLVYITGIFYGGQDFERIIKYSNRLDI